MRFAEPGQGLPGDTPPGQRIRHLLRAQYAAARVAAGLRRGQGAEAEVDRLDTLSGLLAARRVRPSALLPLWDAAGCALGAAAAALGPRAAAACAEGLEQALDEHDRDLAATLPDEEAPLRDAMEQARAEALDRRPEPSFDSGSRLLSGLVRAGCRAAMRISERL